MLTSVGLDHTEWLGETLEEIAAEKLAVLRDHSTLLTGALSPEVQAVAEREAERRHAKLLWATAVASNLVSGYQAGNFALAQAAAAQLVEKFDPAAALPVIERLSGDGALVPGRAQLVRGDPDAVYDAAHNPDGARALAETLPEPGRRRRSGLLPRGARGKGRGRDRRGACAGLRPLRLHGDPGGGDARHGPARRRVHARRQAGAALSGGGVERRGGHRPLGCVGARDGSCARARRGGAGRRFPLPSQVHMDREARGELLTMMGLVALVVAVVILVFFAIGYVFGLFFL